MKIKHTSFVGAFIAVLFSLLTTLQAANQSPHATGGYQKRSDTGATISAGGTIPQGVGVNIGATVTDPDAGDTIRIEVELHQLPASFTGTANYVSSYVSSGSVASVPTITGLASGNYGWRYRAVDNHGLPTNWVLEGNPDFIVQAAANQSPHATGGFQKRADTLAAIPAGGTIPQGVGVNLGATVTDPDAGDTIRIEVELHQLPASFTGTANYVSSYVSSGSVANVPTITGLAAGSYGWRYRAVDNHGLPTNWVLEGNPDFIVQAANQSPHATGGFQKRADTLATIPTGGTIPQGVGVNIGATVTDPDAGDTIRIEVELHQLPATFTGTANYVSSYVSSGSVASVPTITGLAAGNYGWRYRAVDNHGLPTNWVLENNPDFIVQGDCTYSLSSYSASPGSGAGFGSFSVYAGSGCAWSAVSDATSWLQASGSGPGNGTVNYTYDVNPNATSRTGHITVQSQTFTVTQTGSSVVDYPGATWMGPAASGNYESGRNGNSKTYIIVHTTEGSMASALSRFQTVGQQASSHYIIGTNGIVWQVVRDADTAYNCANLTYNYQSIGIEQEGWADGNPDFSWQTTAQRTALENLINWLHTQYGIPLDRAHVIGHNQVPSPGSPYPPTTEWGGADNHHDPGAWFNWRHIMTDLGDAPAYNPINVQSAASITTLPQSGAPIIVPASPGQKFVAYDYYNGYYLVFLSGHELAQTGLASGEYHWDGWIPAANVTIDNSLTQLEVTNAFPSRWVIHSSPSLSASVIGRTIDGKRYVATGNTTVADGYTWREFYIATTAAAVVTGWVVADGLTVISGSDAQGPALSILPLGLTFSSSSRSVVDLQVFYTPAASAEALGDANLLNEIRIAVRESNQAYVNSRINHRLRLLSIEPINYVEAASIGPDIDRLIDKTNVYLYSVHSRRNQVGADIVALIIASSSTDPAGGGIAKTMHPADLSPAFESNAFCVVRRPVMIDKFGLPHEIGHIMGCGHDHARALIDGTNGIGVYPYSYGYILPGNNYGDIMSYPAPVGASYIQYFSNPDVLYGGIPTGVREDQPQPANTALTMNNTAATVAAFRNTVFAGNVITISNSSASQITVTSISPETPAPWLSVSPQGSFSINPGTAQNVTVQVDYGLAPSGYSNVRLLIITNNASASPIPGGIAVIVDNDTPPPTRVISLSGNMAFGNVTVGTSAQSTLTIANNGNSTLTVSNINYPSGFSGNWSGTIPQGNSQNVNVTFSPVSAISYSGNNLVVNSDKTSGTGSMAISGVGINRPSLSISRQGSNLVFTWPTDVPGFTLEYTTNLPATSWTLNSVLPAIVGGNYTVTNPITGGNKFYRLKK